MKRAAFHVFQGVQVHFLVAQKAHYNKGTLFWVGYCIREP